MTGWILRLAGLALLLALAGCATPDEGPREVELREMLESNQRNLARLAVGMSQREVRALMGNLQAMTRDGPVGNPVRSDVYVAEDGQRYDVLYYYTTAASTAGFAASAIPI